MTGPIARIILRYGAAALVTYGLLPHEIGEQVSTDPDLIALLGVAIGVLTEAAYAYAKRNGGAT